mgnify:CR=1 FL=1
MKKYTVCLVGRPNVGKSTLFNRIIGKKISIIDDAPGVTRDRIYGSASFNNFNFYLIDTGGIDIKDENWNNVITNQVMLAIDESDVIVFVVDGKEGVTSNDEHISELLHKCGKKVVVAINKIDSKIAENNMYEFYSLGFENYVTISAEHNIGISDLFNNVFDNLDEGADEIEDDRPKFCIIGRPNVGKSSLVNALLNEERVIVSNIAGTTRDSIDTVFKYENNEYILIDTAGLRKKGRIYENVEKYSLLRSMKAIDRSDVCILIINAEEGIIEHDKHIAGYAIDAGKGIVIVVNKWDKVENDYEKWKTDIKNNFQFISYAEIVFLSALTKKRLNTLMPKVLESYNNYTKEIKTSVINDIVLNAFIETPPPSYKGKKLKIYFTHQSGIKPPRFDIEVNSKGLVHFSYERYLENRIRANIDFTGTPIKLYFKNKGE